VYNQNKLMLLTSGTRLGPYEILAPLGAGGMGEVYRARDIRLGREVAIKILPASCSANPERVRRFEQEARASSALNHPNIVSVYDFGTSDSTIYITMELIDGKTLKELQSSEPLPVRKLLDIAAQITDGLAKAHDAGIFHRDLKPQNIMMSKDGFAKILDFGLAKLSVLGNEDFSQVATLEKAITQEGIVLGTVAYMSPEQSAGLPIDFRSDQFSVGVILYELSSGKHPFQRSTSAETLASIIREEPVPIGNLNPQLPAPFRWIIERCLAKKPEDRYASTRDLTRELGTIRAHISEISDIHQIPRLTKTRFKRREIAAWIIAAFAFLATFAVTMYALRNKSIRPGAIRLSVLPPDAWQFAVINLPALSPDGRMLAFVAESGQNQKLWIRNLDTLVSTQVHGDDAGFYPFWSPDSRFLGLFTTSKLKKIDISTGAVQTICDFGSISSISNGARGGTWSGEGTILFGTSEGPIYRVSDAGGSPVAVTKLNQTRTDISHRWPSFLPDGRHFFYEVVNENGDKGGIFLSSIDSKEEKAILSTLSNAVYSSGYLFYGREGGLLAQPFDVKKLQLAGTAVSVADQVQYLWIRGTTTFSVSANGILAYSNAGFGNSSQLLWFDRAGNRVGQVETTAGYYDLKISHSGNRLAVAINNLQSALGDIWIYDLQRNLATKLTFDPREEGSPVWSPDDSSILFSRSFRGTEIYRQSVSTTNPAERLYSTKENVFPSDFSSDGRFVICRRVTAKGKGDLWIFSMQTRKMDPFIQTEFNERQGQFSPDNRWIAYTSNESGKPEVYVSDFQGAGRRFQISNGGATSPRWRQDGKELFYLSADNKLMAVAVKVESIFEASEPKALFQIEMNKNEIVEYDSAPDGQHFLMDVPLDQRVSPITIVLHWPSLLQ
jgi:serine/threonine protein kinase